MNIFSYGLMALVILAISAPALVLAETENEINEGTNENVVKQPTTSTTETESEGSEGKSSGSTNSNIVLIVTIAAIVGVIGYSAWKVYKIRRRATSKTLV